MTTRKIFTCIFITIVLGGVNFGCPEKPEDSAVGKLKFGAYYSPRYDQAGKHWQKKNLRLQLIPAQEPKLGRYDCRDESVIKQHVAWAQEAGIDFFALNWWGSNTSTDITIKKHFAPYLDQNQSDFKFCLVYLTPFFLKVKRDGTLPVNLDAQTRLLKDFLYLSRNYFKHPNYLKINGRPVLIMYLSRLLTGDYEKIIPRVKAVVRQQTKQDIFLVGDEVFWDEPNQKRIGIFDGITSYNMYGRPLRYDGYAQSNGFFSDLGQTYNEYRKIAGDKKVKFIPNVMPGYNNRAATPKEKRVIWPREVNHLTTEKGTFYQEYFQVARQHLDPDLPMVLITSWNFWRDDTQIEPVKKSRTPIKHPFALTGEYGYFGYDDLYLRITRKAKSVLARPVD